MNKKIPQKISGKYKINGSNENRNLIQDIANQRRTYYGCSKYGCHWHSIILPDGRQLWTLIWNNQICNARINTLVFNFHPLWGFSESPEFNKKPKDLNNEIL